MALRLRDKLITFKNSSSIDSHEIVAAYQDLNGKPFNGKSQPNAEVKPLSQNKPNKHKKWMFFCAQIVIACVTGYCTDRYICRRRFVLP